MQSPPTPNRGTDHQKVDAPYRSGPSRIWIKVKNPKAPAATRVIDLSNGYRCLLSRHNVGLRSNRCICIAVSSFLTKAIHAMRQWLSRSNPIDVDVLIEVKHRPAITAWLCT